MSNFLSRNQPTSSNPSFKFTDVGAMVEGTITETPREVQTDDTYNGGTIENLLVTLETPSGDMYTIWLPLGKRITKAVAEAVADANAEDLETGGVLKIKFTALGEQKKAGYNKPKLYKAQYTPPTPVNTEEF